VHAAHARVRVRAPHEGQVQAAGRLQVIHEAAAPGEQRRVFAPPERLPDPT
jgi:hypothetical protein